MAAESEVKEMTDLEYCDQLEAHMDTGAWPGLANVRALLAMVREAQGEIARLRDAVDDLERMSGGVTLGKVSHD